MRIRITEQALRISRSDVIQTRIYNEKIAPKKREITGSEEDDILQYLNGKLELGPPLGRAVRIINE